MKLDLKSLYNQFKVNSLHGRYITNEKVWLTLKGLQNKLAYDVIGYSVKDRPIYRITLGYGNTRVLIWSQMHGNESTSTKALIDFLSICINSSTFNYLLKHITLCIIPILNPDGAYYYSRLNANKIDLNRDAQNLSQPESQVLHTIFNTFKPHYCFNMHGQRTIFGAGSLGKPASLSFLVPAQDKQLTVTQTRKKAMAIITQMVSLLNKDLEGCIGRYDDAFNINCVGDTFQKHGVPTILFESGHFPKDYEREISRFYTFKSLVYVLNFIAEGFDACKWKTYFDIPENKKNFFDIIIRSAQIDNQTNALIDIGIQYKEELKAGSVIYKPIVKKMECLNHFYAHWDIFAHKQKVFKENLSSISLGDEVDIILLNDQKISLKN